MKLGRVSAPAAAEMWKTPWKICKPLWKTEYYAENFVEILWKYVENAWQRLRTIRSRKKPLVISASPVYNNATQGGTTADPDYT